MGIRIFEVADDGDTSMYDGASGWAFGPVAREDKLIAFQLWLRDVHEPAIDDARRVEHRGELERLWGKFLDDPAWVQQDGDDEGDITTAASERVEAALAA